MTNSITRTHNGETLRLVASVETTPHSHAEPKSIHTDSTTVEVIVSDGRMQSLGSQWGHVAIDIDGQVYGMSPKGYDQRLRSKYLEDNGYRDSIGVRLRVSQQEKENMRAELDKWRKLGTPYNLLANSCSTNIADVLESIGILAHDPRFFFAPNSTAGVSPKELLIVIKRSKRVASTHDYPKR